MSTFRKILHSVLFSVVIFAILAALFFLITHESWIAKLGSLCLASGIGYFFGVSQIIKPIEWVMEEPKETIAEEEPIEEEE